MVGSIKGRFDHALDRGAIRNATRSGHTDLNTAASGICIDTSDCHGSLSQGIGLSINTTQLGHNQATAAQRLGHTNGRDIDINTLTWFGKWWQLCGHHNRGYIFDFHFFLGILRRQIGHLITKIKITHRSINTDSQT